MQKKNNPTDVSLADTWRLPLVLTGLLVVAVLLIYYPTTASMIHIWNNSETFTHGYLILPISIWLVWHNKHFFYHIQPQPNYYAIPLILLASFGWLIAYYVDVQVVQQLALVSLIPLIVLAVLGWETVKAAAFPLFFLIFAVPMGEGLVPSLIEFTADFTVSMVQMTGIPIYREGTFFQLPTGDWSVVEACSGVRYLIASVTLGFLYAYLTYQSLYRRVVFVIVSIIVPIIANGLRAFMIVMIGHFSDMKLATGVDHLIYGWVFFGIVIMIMFYIGSFWREDEKIEDEVLEQSVNASSLKSKKQFIVSTFILLAVLSLLPVKAYTEKVEAPEVQITLNAPESNKWKLSGQLVSSWEPRYENMDATLHKAYINKQAHVDLFIGYYQTQRENAQLITSTNVLTKEKDEWKNVGETLVDLSFSGSEYQVPVAHLKNGSKEILVAYFYYLDDQVVTNDYKAKLLEAKNRLLGGDRSASIIAISSEFYSTRGQAVSIMTDYVHDMGDLILNIIDRANNSE